MDEPFLIAIKKKDSCPCDDQPTTGNEIVDKIADFTGGAAGLVVNPGGVGTSTQNLFTTTNKMASSLAATKGGQIVQNTMSKSLEKVMNPNAAQRITQYTLTGAVTGSLHSTSLSLIQNKSSGKELLEAALWGGAFGGAFGAIGGMLSPVLGKVFTAARQYTSKLKPNQIIANLKQSMKQKVVTGNPLAANPIRKGLETRGYKPKPGERTTTKEQYKAQEQKTREALRAEKAKGTAKVEQFDFKSWEEMPVSGQIRIAPNGQRLMSVRELKTFKKEMSANNIKIIIDKKGDILPSNAAAGFNPETGQIVLRREPTSLSALHESYHAQQWRRLGKENYLKQSTLEREEYVYNEIMRNKDKFSEAEVLFSQRYIYKLRHGNWPPQDWKGFQD